MFRTDLLSIIRSLNTVFTAIGICHTSYVDCLLARSVNITSMLSSLVAYIVRQYSSDNKGQQDAPSLNINLAKNSTCFGQIYGPSSGVLVLYSQQLVFVILVVLIVCYKAVNITSMTKYQLLFISSIPTSLADSQRN